MKKFFNIGQFQKEHIPWNKGKKGTYKHSIEANIKKSIISKGRKLSETTKRKMSNSKKGENNPNWKGGISEENYCIRRSAEFRNWRESVFKRDNWTCIWCGVKSGNGKRTELHPDHIKPFALFPELRFAIDNGRTLCRNCHYKTKTFGFRKNYKKAIGSEING